MIITFYHLICLLYKHNQSWESKESKLHSAISPCLLNWEAWGTAGREWNAWNSLPTFVCQVTSWLLIAPHLSKYNKQKKQWDDPTSTITNRKKWGDKTNPQLNQWSRSNKKKTGKYNSNRNRRSSTTYKTTEAIRWFSNKTLPPPPSQKTVKLWQGDI